MNDIAQIAPARNSEREIVDRQKHSPLTREQWATRSIADGTDWQSLGEAVFRALVTAGIIELEPTTFERACEQADKRRRRRWRTVPEARAARQRAIAMASP